MPALAGRPALIVTANPEGLCHPAASRRKPAGPGVHSPVMILRQARGVAWPGFTRASARLQTTP